MYEFLKANKSVIEKAAIEIGTPFFAVNVSDLETKVNNIRNSFPNYCSIYYAMKANYNPHIIKLLKSLGVKGIETISIFEVELSKLLDFSNKNIIFTCNNADEYELDLAKKMGVIINIGSINELRYFCNKYNGTEISIRINPGFGDGEFASVITGGKKSKFGILHTELEEALRLIKHYKIKLIGIHCHLGSGIYDTLAFSKMVKYMFSIANSIPDIKFIDLGGGFGVRYRKDDPEIKLNYFSDIIVNQYQSLKKPIEIIFEPGKYLVAESTYLITKVTNIREMVCVDTGLNHMIRPALYGANHEIINLSKINKETEYQKSDIVGNICESTDILSKDVYIKNPEKGDLLAILTAGAYCSSMSSLYNLRAYAAEIFIKNGNYKISRKRQCFNETFESLGFQNYSSVPLI